jgi:preprotein translocase subunit SecG
MDSLVLAINQGTFNLIVGIVLLVAALFLIVAVLIQSGKSKGAGAVTGGSSETYFGKNKGKGIDKKLAILTGIVAVIFVLVVLFAYISQPV